jgi:hypothetical protein
MQVRYDNLGPDTDISKPEHFKALYTLFFFCPMVLQFFRENDISAASVVESLKNVHNDAIDKIKDFDVPAVDQLLSLLSSLD